MHGAQNIKMDQNSRYITYHTFGKERVGGKEGMKGRGEGAGGEEARWR